MKNTLLFILSTLLTITVDAQNSADMKIDAAIEMAETVIAETALEKGQEPTRYNYWMYQNYMIGEGIKAMGEALGRPDFSAYRDQQAMYFPMRIRKSKTAPRAGISSQRLCGRVAWLPSSLNYRKRVTVWSLLAESVATRTCWIPRIKCQMAPWPDIKGGGNPKGVKLMTCTCPARIGRACLVKLARRSILSKLSKKRLAIISTCGIPKRNCCIASGSKKSPKFVSRTGAGGMGGS